MNETDPTAATSDIRPLVARPVGNQSIWLFVTAVALGAGLLFYSLESRRASLSNPSTLVSAQDGAPGIIAPPDLSVPPQYDPSEIEPARYPIYGLPERPGPVQAAPRPIAGQPARLVPTPIPPASTTPAPIPTYGEQPTAPPTPTTVFQAPSGPRPSNAEGENEKTGKEERVRATRFANPSTTIPKGTLIQAVLETALDSTRAGYARAIVSRDVFSFDGSKVLVPKGSRLIGEYKADLAAGQNRALIQWQRMMRPDGVVINVDSPTADPLGRAGVKGAVNTHFLERFSGAILQSALDIGVQLATRRISRDSVIFALPGSTQGIVGVAPDKIQPTLKVRQGTSVSVFVARDLDFTSVDR